MLRVCLCNVILIVSTMPMLRGQDLPVIQGQVVDAAGTPVGQAVVSLTQQWPAGPVNGFTPYHARATSRSDGTFVLPNTTAGTFTICASVPNSDYLGTCLYGGAVTVAADATKTVSVPAITIKKGVRVNVRVNDPNGAVTRWQTSTPVALFVRAVAAGCADIPARSIGVDKTGFNMDVLVPFDTAVTLVASSPAYTLGDNTGNTASSSAGMSYKFTVPTGTTSSPTLTVSVTGIASGAK